MIETEKPDVVIVTSIDRTHHRYIVKAMEMGCDVISEKPMTVDEVKFRKPILPGDVIEFTVKKEQAVRNVFKFRGEAKVDGKLVSQATFSAMVFKKA